MINQLLGEFHFNTQINVASKPTSPYSVHMGSEELLHYVLRCLINKKPVQFKEENCSDLFSSKFSQFDHDQIETALLKEYAKTFSHDPYFAMVKSRVMKSNDSIVKYLCDKKESLYVKDYKISKYYDVLIERIAERTQSNAITTSRNSLKERGEETSRAIK